MGVRIHGPVGRAIDRRAMARRLDLALAYAQGEGDTDADRYRYLKGYLQGLAKLLRGEA